MFILFDSEIKFLELCFTAILYHAIVPHDGMIKIIFLGWAKWVKSKILTRVMVKN